MAFRLLSTAAPRYAGLSSDEKPTPATQGGASVEAGSTFLEEDTGRVFRWDGSRWARAAVAEGGAGALDADAAPAWAGALLTELRKIRRGIETALGTVIPDPGE